MYYVLRTSPCTFIVQLNSGRDVNPASHQTSQAFRIMAWHFTPDTPLVVMEWNDETRAQQTEDGTVALPPLRGNRGPKQRLAAAGPGPHACTAQAAVAVRVVTKRRRGRGGKGGTLTTRQASLSQPVAYKTNHTLRRPGRPRPTTRIRRRRRTGRCDATQATC